MEASEKKYFYNFVGNQIKLFRSKKGITQDDLAGLIGMSRVSIANIEVGKQFPPLYVIVSIARSLDTDISTLVDEERWLNSEPSFNRKDFSTVRKADQEKLESFLQRV